VLPSYSVYAITLLDIIGAKQSDSWRARQGPFTFRFVFMFQMGIDFGDELEMM
jgi:hypothetical protein